MKLIPPITEWKVDPEYQLEYADVDLDPAMEYIAKKYVFAAHYTKGYKSLWNGSDGPSMEWHNDLVEGCNVFFLYYHSDVTEGGEICFRVNGQETGCIQPRKHLLVMGSQESHVEHKVNFTKQERIVSNYGFNYQTNRAL